MSDTDELAEALHPTIRAALAYTTASAWDVTEAAAAALAPIVAARVEAARAEAVAAVLALADEWDGELLGSGSACTSGVLPTSAAAVTPEAAAAHNRAERAAALREARAGVDVRDGVHPAQLVDRMALQVTPLTAPTLSTAVTSDERRHRRPPRPRQATTKVKGIPRAADVLTDLRHVIDNRATGGWGSDPHVVPVAELEALIERHGRQG